MTLNMIGLGVGDKFQISLAGLNAIKKCSRLFIDSYTSIMEDPVPRLEEFYGKKIIIADRNLVESGEEIILSSKEEEVAFLVPGDVFSATTHIDLLLRAKKAGVPIRVFHSASILTLVSDTGLDLYKFGRTTTLVTPSKGFFPMTPYDVIKENLKRGLHTLLLLDIDMENNRLMTIKEAVALLNRIESLKEEKVFLPETPVVGCARLGFSDSKIVFSDAGKIATARLGKPPHCLIIPGKLHFIEEEALSYFREIKKG